MNAIPATAAACRTIISFLLWIGRRVVTRRRKRVAVASQRHQRCRGSIRRSNKTTIVRDAHRSRAPAQRRSFYHGGKRWRISPAPRNSRFFVEFEFRPPSPATGLKPAEPGGKIPPLPRDALLREHDEQGCHQDCYEARDARSASAPPQRH